MARFLRWRGGADTPRNVLNIIAICGNQADHALRPKGRDHASGPPAPIIPRKDGLRDRQRIHQRQQIRPQSRLFAGTGRCRIQKPGRAIAAQIGHQDAKPLGGKLRRHAIPDADIIGKAMEQDGDQPSFGTAHLHRHVQHPGLYRLEFHRHPFSLG